MKRSIVIIACVIAAVVIIPLVAQTSRSGSAEQACPAGEAQACKMQCEDAKKCEDCPKQASGECQGCDKQCKAGEGCGDGPKAECTMEAGGAFEPKQASGMGQGCGMGGGCGMGMGAEI